VIFLRLLFWLWAFTALAAGNFQWLQRLPAPAVQGILFGLTALLLAIYFGSGVVRAAVDRVDLRRLVLFHVTRFIGFYFLRLHARGELPYDFAVPGGYGDIIVAALALVAALAPLSAPLRLRAISIWNVVGFVDIMFVVATAARLGHADPSSMRALTYLPLSLLPTFLVPLLIASHVVIYARLKNASASA
jgi:hypothetical protein